MIETVIVIGMVFGLPLLFALLGIRIVRPIEVGVVERFGKYKRTAQAGFRWIIPIVDRMIFVNLTERLSDVQPQDIITKDNLNARVDLMVYYKVKENFEDIKKSVYKVANFERQIVSLAQTTARNVIGSMHFADVNSKRNELNAKLAKILDNETNAWGVEIVRVELREIVPPEDVQATMNQVIKAENEKDAALDFATATETKADGEKRAEIKYAQGVKQSKILKAEGEARAIELVNTSANKYFIGNAKDLKKLEVTQASLMRNSKIVVPSSSELINVIGDLAGTPLPIAKKKK